MSGSVPSIARGFKLDSTSLFVDVQTALGFIEARPSARTRVFARFDFDGAKTLFRLAADAEKATLAQRVIRQMILLQIVVDVLGGPGRNGTELEETQVVCLDDR